MRQTIAKVFIMILVTSCLEQNEFQKQNQFEINFDKEAFSIVTGTDFNVDWNSGTNYFSEDLGMDYLEFPVVIEDNSGNIKGNYRINFTLLATQKDENNFEFYMVKFYEETRNTSAFVENISFSETEKFSGLVHVLDKNNELYFARKLKNGAILDQNLFSRENKSSDNSSRMQEDCYTVTTYHYTDWYVNGAYVDSWLNNITHETYCYSYYLPDLFTSGGGGSGSYGSNGGDAYDNCGDPIHGCIYKIKNETLVDFYTCPENFTFSTATNSNL